ncbi:MAG: TetR/AcrR family transcriptional regulator [Aggregatilineales bacterium]
MTHVTNGSVTRRQQIQSAAKELFRTRGYLATSMRDIANKMQLSGGGSLYAHIQGKEELLWDIATEAMDAFFEAQNAILSLDLPPVPKLRRAMISHVLVILNRLDAAAVYFDEWRHLSELRRAEFSARRDAYERHFQTLIHAGLLSGELAAADERFATLYALGALNAIRRWYRPGGRLSAETVATFAADTVLNGLMAR